MVYIFFFALLILVILDRLTSMSFGFDNLTKIHINAPYVIYSLVSTWLVVGLLFGAAFVQGAATRDFSSKFSEILLTTPVRKRDFFFGRYLGSTIMLIVPFIACYIGFLIASLIGPSDKTGEFMLLPYIFSFLLYLIPGVIVSSALMFAITILTRKAAYAFVIAIILFILYGYAQHYSQNLENRNLVLLLDPFGPVSLKLITRYWTVSDYNTIKLPVNHLFIIGRICWMCISGTILFTSYLLFSFSVPSKKRVVNIQTEKPPELQYKAIEIPVVNQFYNIISQFKKVLQQSKTEFAFTVKSLPFIIFSAMAIINILTSDQPTGYEISHYPLTYFLIETLFSSLFNFFLFAIIVFYSGVLVWRERDVKMTELFDATPIPSWIPFISKIMVLSGIIAFVLLLATLTSILIQASNGFFDFRIGIYFKWMVLILFPRYLMYGILAIFLHTLINNKYLAYAVFILFLSLQNVMSSNLGFSHGLYQFAYHPQIVYSDMNGFKPFVSGIFWYKVYWSLFTILLCFITVRLWRRGIETTFKSRWKLAVSRSNPTIKAVFVSVVLIFIATGGYIYFNTIILNNYSTPAEKRLKAAQYEKKYKKFEDIPQPRIVHASLNVDIYPHQRDLSVKGKLLLKNKTVNSIDSLHLVCNDYMDEINIQVENGVKIEDDNELNYLVFKLEPALTPGDSLYLEYESKYESKGFENSPTHLELIQNGTFIHEGILLPAIGYQPGREIRDKKYRKSFGLPKRKPIATITDKKALMKHDCPSADWMTFDTIISTAMDQIAIAPGILIEEYTKNNRKYYHYKLQEPPVVNFYPVLSGIFEIKKEKFNDVNIEIYYHKEHPYNINKMITAVKRSLEYYTENFGKYPYEFARIVEFPRYRGGARAYPGTIPYSESAGFIYKIDDKDDIDMVFAMTVHEMAHQWWGHQVVGAEVEGYRILTETLAQYSELMVFKKEYGEKLVVKFLRYEMDNYLSRRNQIEHEPSLLQAADQDPVIYHKGMIVMNALRHHLGEDKVNNALRKFYKQYAYTEPPYPTSMDLYQIIKEETPDALHDMLTDMFESITLYNNKIEEATYKELNNGKYLLKLNIECKKINVDSLGIESEIPVNDWIEIGVYSNDSRNEWDENRLVYLKKFKIDTFTFQEEIILDHKPVQAYLDPHFLLIDKFPYDNMKNVMLEGGNLISDDL